MFNISQTWKTALLFGVVIVSVVFVGLAYPALAGNISPAQAATAAKNVLIKEANKGGIGFEPSDVKASCKQVEGEARTFRCSVNANGGQCKGTLTIYEEPGKGYRATDKKIGCGE